MLRRAAVVAAVALAAVASTALAHSFSGHLVPLEDELALRRDEDFGGTLDSVAKKRLKAVVKSLALIEKEADDLGDDLKTAGKVSGLLEKVYGEEITLTAKENLGSLLSDLAASLRSDVANGISALEGRIPGLSAKGAVKVQKAVDKANAAAEGAGAFLPGKTFYKALAKAYKSTAKGVKAADKDSGGGGASSLSMNIGSFAFTGGPDTKIEIHGSNDAMQVSASAPGPGGTWYLYVYVPGVTAADTYALDAGGVTAFVNFVPDSGDPTQYDALPGGTLTVTTFDPPNRVAGTFAFPANNASAGPTAVSGGTFDITAIETYP